MTKKNKDLVKKSRSTEDLITKPDQTEPETRITQLEQQLQKAQEQLSNLQKSLGQHDPSLLRKAREELIAIKKKLEEIFPNSSAKPNELCSQLITQHKELIDHNNELRLVKLKNADYQKELIKTQQDLQQAQRIIELGLTKPERKEIDY
jgi:hypothetical protein